MLFSSIPFLAFFLPVVLLTYYMLPGRNYRNWVLLLSSLLFYSWGEPTFLFLMLASIIFNYNMGLRLGDDCVQKRKTLLAFAVAANLACLFVFKYLGFSVRIIDSFLNALHCKPLEALNTVLPLGISFYTFQEISYLVDVYKNPEQSQKSLRDLGLYISFFPQLIAGPIVRYHDIKGQIECRNESISQFASGLERFIMGLSKKVLIANVMANVCDSIYGDSFFSYGTYVAWIAALAYALQIYYDFSGYSDMAIGLARLFGFELKENFNYPYAASSITDFWKRWHISLTGFFRDYVYIPLGGNRRSKARTAMNRLAVFFLTGLWHGAAFNFIFWGLAHGFAMTLERKIGGKSSEKTRNPFVSFIHRVMTLLAVLLLWVLFRNTTKESIKILLKMFGMNYTILKHGGVIPFEQGSLFLLQMDARFYTMMAAGVLFSFPWWRKVPLLHTKGETFATVLAALKYLTLGVLLVLCYASLADGSYNPFIYFRF